ncbi:polysaccharide deacetylase family protein [Roseovarius sp. 2305UL8-3]|uniref:polysaccharide deacetylase family protein n=1 Tax=Roseovarius conchicola TaxID=3121636 RepID=UPI0035271C6C
MKYIDIPNQPRNRAVSHETMEWPKGKKSALFLSFDFDAETGWIDENPNDWHKEVAVSHGGYGARVGVRKILELLQQLELNATFFVPGWVALAHTEVCENILIGGHEIGHHGMYHLLPSADDRDRAIEEIDKGFEALKNQLGVQPVGYRAPLGENSGEFLDYLYSRGIRYSSSWRDDVLPYRHVLENGSPAPIELPANYFFDDWMHSMIKGSGRNFVAPELVQSIWRAELDETHDWGALTTTVYHPQVSGRPSPLRTLREFLGYAKSKDDLWITTGERIARHVETTL